MKKIKVKLHTQDPFKNTHYLFADSDEFGFIKYNLRGKSGMAHCLGNMQIKEELPCDLDEFENVDDLVKEIARVVNTGTEKFVETIFAKSL